VRRPRSIRSRAVGFRMTAMIDMAFLLITFFVMSLRLGQQGEELVELPRADQAQPTAEREVEFVTINVTAEGRYVLGGVERSAVEVTRYLDERRRGAKRIELVIRGDRRSPFEAVQRLMRLAGEAGVARVSLAALRLPEEEGP